jgi:hypothetical protein
MHKILIGGEIEMKQGFVKAGIISVLVLFVLSCTTVSFQGIQSVNAMPAFTVVGDFEKVITDHRLIGSPGGFALLELGQPDEEIFRIIKDEVSKMSGDGAVNVEIDYGFSFLNFLLNGITFGIYSPSRIIVRGKIVKFTK